MAVLIFDIQSGISGDMILGAALDLGVDEEQLRVQLGSLGLKFELKSKKIVKKGIASRKFSVTYPSEKKSRHLNEILGIISGSGLSESVKVRSIGISNLVDGYFGIDFESSRGKSHNSILDSFI